MTKLIKIDPKEFGLTETKAKEVAAMFQPMLDKMVELENEYNALTQSIEGEPSEDDCKRAKELRIQYVKVRTGTAAIHKELKAFYLAGGRFVDGWKNAQLMASQGIEERLKEIETHQERKEAERKAALEVERKDELRQYTSDIPSGLGDMPDNVWEMYLAGAKKAHFDRLEAERKAEEERKRIEAEEKARRKAEAIRVEKERERIRKENERLRKEAAERERKAAEERRKREAEEQARRKAEALRIKKEQEERERVQREYQAKLEAERQEKLKIQRQVEAKRKAEEEAKRKAAEEAEAARQAELAKGDQDILDDLQRELLDITKRFGGSRWSSLQYRLMWASIHRDLHRAIEKTKTMKTEETE